MSPAPTNIKVLAEEQRAGVAGFFVGVAYNSDTYQQLQKSSPVMPNVDTELFKSRAVVVVFLGQRPTAGYGIKIEEVTDGVRVTEARPAPGTMVAQVLSSPLKVVSVPVSAGKPLNVRLEPGMNLTAKSYKVESGEFSFTGGIAGRQTKFTLGGDLLIFRHEKFVSVLFNLEASGAGKPRSLHTVASGIVDPQGNMLFGQVDPGTLIEFPYAPLRAEGTWTDTGVWMTFESLMPTVADGYEGRGTLRAKYLPVK